MRLACRFRFPGLRQALLPILADRLEQDEAGFFLPLLHCLVHQVLVEEGGHALQHVHRLITERLADGLDRFQRKAADEGGELLEETLFLRRQQVVAPGNRVAQRLLPCWRIACPTRQDLESMPKPCEECLWRQQFAAGSC